MLAVSPLAQASAGSAQVEDKLFSPTAYISPNGENVVFIDALVENGRNLPSIKLFNIVSNTTKEISSSTIPYMNVNWSNLASDKYFCWVDTTYTANGSPTITYFDFASGKTSKIEKTPAFILNLAVGGSFAVWIEANHDEGLSVWAKNLGDNTAPSMISKLSPTQDNSTLSAFNWKGKDYALFDTRLDGKSTIKLYNLTDKAETIVADTENIEYSPRFQAGKIFFLKSEVTDPSFGLVNRAGGFIECYSMDSQTQTSVDSYDSLIAPTLLVNTRNQSSFVYTLTDYVSNTIQVKRFDIASSTAFVGAKLDNSLTHSIKPESCDGSNLYYTKAVDSLLTSLESLDLLTGNKTVISDSKEVKVFCGYSKGKVIYTATTMTSVPGKPRFVTPTDIKLMVWSN